MQTAEGRDIAVYLVELLSIGGLSGSPVWYVPPQFRVQPDGILQMRAKSSPLLLGLVHGHFSADGRNVDDGGERSVQRLNTGIAMVIPSKRIFETIMQPELEKLRRETIEKHGLQSDTAV